MAPIKSRPDKAVKRNSRDPGLRAIRRACDRVFRERAVRLRKLKKLSIVYAVLTGVAFTCLAACCVLVSHRVAASVLRSNVTESLTTTANLAASMLDPVAHAAIKDDSQQNNPQYLELVKPWRSILRADSQLRYIYSIRRTNDGPAFVLDASESVDADNDGVNDQSTINQPVERTDPAMLAALATGKPAVLEYFHTDDWGTFLSAYAPVLRADGSLECVVGVDMTAEQYFSQVRAMDHAANIGKAMALTGGIALTFIVFFLGQHRERAVDRLHASQNRLNSIFDAVAEGIIVQNTVGEIIECNRSAELALRVPRQYLLGRTTLDPSFQPVHEDGTVFTSDDHPSMITLRTGQPTRGTVMGVDICQQGYRWLSMNTEPIRDVAGNITTVVASFSDITVQKQMLDDLRIAKNVAESATHAKSAFLANMSHEIRTPMTAILGYTNLLAQDAEQTGSAQTLDHICTIQRNGDHLLSIINDILDLSKIEAGKMEITPSRADLQPMIQEVGKLMDVKAKTKGITFQILAESELPEWITTDALRVKQILINLIGNAIKFTSTGGVKLRIGMNDVDGENRLRFAVQDSGIGIKPEHLARVFQAFEQADSSTTRRHGGTGLGLMISKRLTEMLGGEIRVQSVPGAGSIFTSTINPGAIGPLAKISFTELAAPRAQPTAGIAKPNDKFIDTLKGKRILVAEDGADNQRLIRFFLEKSGASVQIVENGKRAVEALTADGNVDGELLPIMPFDVIVTDMQMPEMDGYTLAKTLRSKGFIRPIIALTAHSMQGDADACIAAGCDAYASKPIDRAKLIELCKNTTHQPPTAQAA